MAYRIEVKVSVSITDIYGEKISTGGALDLSEEMQNYILKEIEKGSPVTDIFSALILAK